MKAVAAVAEILKREGTTFLIGYPVNPIIEAAAQADIRTIIVRQERTGLHMADAVSRISSGARIGVFAMPPGPGSENAFGGVAGLRRLRADRRVAGWLPAANHEHPAQLQLVPELPARDEVVRAGHRARRGGGRDAPGLHPGQERAPAPGADRVPGRSPARGRAGADPVHPGAPAALGARSARRLTRRRSARGRSAAGDLRRPGCALRARVAGPP